MTLDDDITLIENRFREQILDFPSMLDQLEWLNNHITAWFLLLDDVIEVIDHNPVLFVEDIHCRDYLSHTIRLHLPGIPPLERDFSVRETENGEFQRFIGHLLAELKIWVQTAEKPSETLSKSVPPLPVDSAKDLESSVESNEDATPQRLAEADPETPSLPFAQSGPAQAAKDNTNADANSASICTQYDRLVEEHFLNPRKDDDSLPLEGRIADLNKAIGASDDDAKLTCGWPVIRDALQERFGQDHSDAKLWERCIDWLQTKGRWSLDDLLPLSLTSLHRLLEVDVPSDQQVVTEKVDASNTSNGESENSNRPKTLSEIGNVAEALSIEHSLQAAVVLPKDNHELKSKIIATLSNNKTGCLDEVVSIIERGHLTTDEKLKRIEKALGIESTVSAQRLAALLGVSKTAVQNTDWYKRSRKGERLRRIQERHDHHAERSSRFEQFSRDDDAD